MEEEPESGSVAETTEKSATKPGETLDLFDDPVFEEDFTITVSEDGSSGNGKEGMVVPSTEPKSDADTSSNDSGTSAPKANAGGGTNPKDLVSQGVSFLSGLVQTLSDPESTEQLVNTLVKEDPDTGKTSVNIPVPDKQSVRNLFTMIGQLMKKM